MKDNNTTPLPEAQPLEGVKTAEEMLNEAAQNLGHADAYDMLWTGEVSVNLPIVLAIMKEYATAFNAQFAIDAGGGEESLEETAERWNKKSAPWSKSNWKLGFIAGVEYQKQHAAPLPTETGKESELIEYILHIHSLTTTEFCKEFGAKVPEWTGSKDVAVMDFLALDAIKWRLAKDKAKELYKAPSTHSSSEMVEDDDFDDYDCLPGGHAAV